MEPVSAITSQPSVLIALTKVIVSTILALILDAHLTWNSQFDAVCKKLVFAIFRLGRLRHVIAPTIMLPIHLGIIQPRLDYALTLWGFTSQLNLSRVQRLQNRAARIITGNFDYNYQCPRY